MGDGGLGREVKLFKWMLFVIAAILVSPLFFMSSSSNPPAPQKVEAPKPTEAECRADITCWRKQHATRIEIECKRAVEREARWDVEWDSWMTSSTFKRYGWFDEKAGTLILFGDSVRFQNGFGAWRRISYSCVFDPATKSAVKVTLAEGRLPD